MLLLKELGHGTLSYFGHLLMALSHKDWELPNSRIWLAEMDIDRFTI